MKGYLMIKLNLGLAFTGYWEYVALDGLVFD